MVEIVKKGFDPEERSYETSCTYCKCVFRFKRKEAVACSDRMETLLKIPCPTCKRDTYTNAA